MTRALTVRASLWPPALSVVSRAPARGLLGELRSVCPFIAARGAGVDTHPACLLFGLSRRTVGSGSQKIRHPRRKDEAFQGESLGGTLDQGLGVDANPLLIVWN